MRYRREEIDAGLQRRVFRVQPDFTYLVYWFGGTRYFRTFTVNADMALGTPDLVNRLSVRDAIPIPCMYVWGIRTCKTVGGITSATGFLHRSPEKKWFTQVNVNAWLGVNDVAQGFSYNSETGVYTYRPQNVDGNRGINGSLAFQKEGMAEYWNVGANLNYDFHRSVDLSSVEGMTESVFEQGAQPRDEGLPFHRLPARKSDPECGMRCHLPPCRRQPGGLQHRGCFRFPLRPFWENTRCRGKSTCPPV
mgnify:CR=1 FL=1